MKKSRMAIGDQNKGHQSYSLLSTLIFSSICIDLTSWIATAIILTCLLSLDYASSLLLWLNCLILPLHCIINPLNFVYINVIKNALKIKIRIVSIGKGQTTNEDFKWQFTKTSPLPGQQHCIFMLYMPGKWRLVCWHLEQNNKKVGDYRCQHPIHPHLLAIRRPSYKNTVEDKFKRKNQKKSMLCIYGSIIVFASKSFSINLYFHIIIHIVIIYQIGIYLFACKLWERISTIHPDSLICGWCIQGKVSS